MIVRGSRELKKVYQDLHSGDIFIGTLAYKHMKPSVLIDLLERGILCFPSPLSQVLNNSKTAQVLILKKWMLPHTFVIVRRSDLLDTMNVYNRLKIAPVITKEDHMHCGHGVRKWDTIEVLYSFMALSESSYPFVVQPYLDNFMDVRVIVVGDYMEAYVRNNPNNFRMNISMGGESRPFDPDENLKRFCHTAMDRGKFPYAHLDIKITDDGKYYLSEIALDGGTKGAQIDHKELVRRKRDLLEILAGTS